MRFLLLLPSLLLSDVAFAQSTASVSTSGAGQRVWVDQSRSTNSAVQIDQIGTGGDVTVIQDGGNASSTRPRAAMIRRMS